MPCTAHMEPAGNTKHKVRLLNKIGQGAFGEVYKGALGGRAASAHGWRGRGRPCNLVTASPALLHPPHAPTMVPQLQ